MKRGSKEKGGKAVWPSLQEQLTASGIIPDSALEKLVRDNQDFETLNPSEANDNFKLPPWLRVYWHKQHPELKPKPGGGGYPLALKEIYEWMLHHQDLPGKKSSK